MKNVSFAKPEHVVFGMGNPQSDILFIGEGPEKMRIWKASPFVGRSGQLLDKMLAAIDLDRNKNILYCKYCKMPTSKNRDPLLEEQEACIDWLRNQVMIMRPKNYCMSWTYCSHEINQTRYENHKRTRYIF